MSTVEYVSKKKEILTKLDTNQIDIFSILGSICMISVSGIIDWIDEMHMKSKPTYSAKLIYRIRNFVKYNDRALLVSLLWS